MPLNIPTKVAGQSVLSSEFNSIVNFVNQLETAIATLSNNLNTANAKLNGFLPASGSGLILTVNSGIIKRVATDQLLNYAGGSISIPANSTNLQIYLLPNLTLTSGAILPVEYYHIATVSSNASSITSIIDRRSLAFEIREKSYRAVVKANKVGNQTIVSPNLTTISGWGIQDNVNENNNFNALTGIYTIPETCNYKVNIRVSLDSVSSITSYSGKLSLYQGGTEIRILDEQTISGVTRIVLQGTYQGILTAGMQLLFRVTIGSGTMTVGGNNNTEFTIEKQG